MASKTQTQTQRRPLIALVGAEIERLMKETGADLLKPEDLLEWAKRHKASATFRFLNEKALSNEGAAERLALIYCRRLIQRIRLKVLTFKRESVPVRGMVSLPSDRAGGNGYRRLEQVMASDELRKELVESAIADAAAWAARARRFEELSPIVEAIDGFIASRPPKKG